MLWYKIIINFHCIFIQHFQLQINYEKKMKKKPTPETFYDHGQYHKFHAFNSCMNDVSIGAKSCLHCEENLYHLSRLHTENQTAETFLSCSSQNKLE